MNTQLSITQAEHWLMIAHACQKLNFPKSLGHENHSFLKEHYEQMMPESLESHPIVCSFYTIYAAFHLFIFRYKN